MTNSSRNSKHPLVSIIIPAFNEELSLPFTLNEIKNAKLEAYEMIVVDDGSVDRTAKVAEEAGAKVIRHDRNEGYGKAILTGVAHAKGSILVFFDADSLFYSQDISKLVKETDTSDLVIGSRYLEQSRRSERIPFMLSLRNKILALMARFLTGVRVTDYGSTFRAVRKEKMEELQLTSRDFSITGEMLMRAAKKGFRISEVPVLYRAWRRL
jgi:glycosyltransferase involved in cell wall biosynthesis